MRTRLQRSIRSAGRALSYQDASSSNNKRSRAGRTAKAGAEVTEAETIGMVFESGPEGDADVANLPPKRRKTDECPEESDRGLEDYSDAEEGISGPNIHGNEAGSASTNESNLEGGIEDVEDVSPPEPPLPVPVPEGDVGGEEEAEDSEEAPPLPVPAPEDDIGGEEEAEENEEALPRTGGMKDETDPEKACVTFFDTHVVFVCCTKQKLDDCTSFTVKGRKKFLVSGLDSHKVFSPEKVVDVSTLIRDGSDDDLFEALVSYASALAEFCSKKSTIWDVLLVCEDALSFANVASVVASFSLLFRSGDVDDCVARITQAFRDQCPSCFGQDYKIPGMTRYIDILRLIETATKDTNLGQSNTVQSIVSKTVSQVDVKEEILAWIFVRPLELPCRARPSGGMYGCYLFPTLPATAHLRGEIASTPSPDAPDWLLINWPSGDFTSPVEELGFMNAFSAASGSKMRSPAACRYLLQKVGREDFFLSTDCGDDPSQRQTPLYTAAKCGDVTLVCWILKSGGDISLDTENNNGKTPLLAACRSGNVDLVKLLILQGAAMTGTRFLSHDESVFGYLDRIHLEKLRLWTKTLIDDDIPSGLAESEFVLQRITLARRLILERYHEFSQEFDVTDDGTGDEIDLASVDHADHEWLKEALDRPVNEYMIEIEARERFDAATLKRLFPEMYRLCSYGEN